MRRCLGSERGAGCPQDEVGVPSLGPLTSCVNDSNVAEGGREPPGDPRRRRARWRRSRRRRQPRSPANVWPPPGPDPISESRAVGTRPRVSDARVRACARGIGQDELGRPLATRPHRDRDDDGGGSLVGHTSALCRAGDVPTLPRKRAIGGLEMHAHPARRLISCGTCAGWQPGRCLRGRNSLQTGLTCARPGADLRL
jgi:hypothetical protein